MSLGDAQTRIALYHNLPSGGAKRAVYEWTRRLTADEIDVFTLSSADHAFCDIRSIARSHRVYDFTPRKGFRSPWGRLNQLQRWLDLGKLNQVNRRISDEINAGGYDVVFANGCLYSHIPAFLQHVRIPTVFYLHEPFGSRFNRDMQRPYLHSKRWREVVDPYDPLIKLLNRRLEKVQLGSLWRTTRVLANSVFTQEQMHAAFGVESLVSRLGVDCEAFRPIQNIHKERHVISVGELTPRKGFDFLVHSLGLISSKHRPPLVLACNRIDPAERNHVQSLAVRYGVELRVLTNLSTKDLAIEYNAARLCVYAPSLEPFGLVPLEAMSCGTAVVGVREGGVQETVVDQRTGLLVSRDPSEFAKAIEHLLFNPYLSAQYGREGREEVLANWTWDKSAAILRDHLSCFGSVVGSEGLEHDFSAAALPMGRAN